MISPKTIVIVYLSIALGVCQYLWIKAEKKAAYLEGRQSVYNEFAADGTEGTCYAKKGDCHELQTIRHK